MEKKTLYSNLIITDITNSKILFLKRSDTVKLCPRQWCFPGGHMESDEEPGSAAMCEALEETGLDFIGKLIPMSRGMYQNKTAICFYYQVDIDDSTRYGTLRLVMDEHQNYCWCTPYDAITKLDLMLDLGDQLQTMFFNIR